jgi:hypothetical protein
MSVTDTAVLDVSEYSVLFLSGLLHADRIATPGPTRGVDLWWSGKHRHHGGNIQAVSAPDGWPMWTSDVRPGREHDTTAARADPDLLTQIAAWVDDGQLGVAVLGYEGEAQTLRIPIKKPADGELTVDQQAYNAVHGALRCLGERANSLLKTTFKALRRWRGCPGHAPPRTPPNHMTGGRDHSRRSRGCSERLNGSLLKSAGISCRAGRRRHAAASRLNAT